MPQIIVACEAPTAEIRSLIESEEYRIDAAIANAEAVLVPLMVFKGLHDEDLEQFSARLREVFDNYVTHRRNTGIELPFFPEVCTDT